MAICITPMARPDALHTQQRPALTPGSQGVVVVIAMVESSAVLGLQPKPPARRTLSRPRLS